MSLFKPALDNVVKIEGGYAEPPAVEQPTNHGITQTDYDGWRARHNLPKQPVKLISDDETSDYYEEDWWDVAPFASVNDQVLTNRIFQTCVLSGLTTGIEILQTALVLLGHDNVTVDKQLSALEVEIINGENPKAIDMAMRVAAGEHYLDIASRFPEKRKYIRGWMTRALS